MHDLASRSYRFGVEWKSEGRWAEYLSPAFDSEAQALAAAEEWMQSSGLEWERFPQSSLPRYRADQAHGMLKVIPAAGSRQKRPGAALAGV